MCRILSVIMQTSLLLCVTSSTKGVDIKWQEFDQKALDQRKCSLTPDEVMAYFDPHRKAVLFVDASAVGLGAMLTKSGKMISYASTVCKALSSVESH